MDLQASPKIAPASTRLTGDHDRTSPGKTGRYIAAAAIGSGCEYYDFTVFTFFAVFVGKTYFPAVDPTASLLLSLATLAAGFLMRPIGSIVIGDIADRTGRKAAMIATIVLMTLGTIGVAATPSYRTIGIAAPIIVVLARLVQGVAFGGEIGVASAYIVELAPPGRRNFYLSVQSGITGIATVLAGAIGAGLAAIMPNAAFASWGWRLAFIAGLLIIPVGIYIRRTMPETLHGSEKRNEVKITHLLRHYYEPTLLVTVAFASITISVYTSFYMTTYSIAVLGLPAAISIAVVIATGLVTVGAAFVPALFADGYGEMPFIVGPKLLLIILSYPMFALLVSHPGPVMLMLTASIIMALTIVSSTVSVSLFARVFPLHVRSTGLAFPFAIATCLFGGTTQLVLTGLIKLSRNPMWAAYYLIIANLVGIVAVFRLIRIARKFEHAQ